MKTYRLLIRDTAAEASAQAGKAYQKVRETTANIQRGILTAGIAVIIAAMPGCAVKAVNKETALPIKAELTVEKTPTAAPTPSPVEALEIEDMPDPMLETARALLATEDSVPLEREKAVEALLPYGCFSDAIPMAYEYQGYMRTYCAEYGCPYPLALAVAEVESNFDMDAVGAVGEVGIMQLNPGPGGSYHAELEAATGLDPATPEGNIAGGCYLLGKFLKRYGDPATAVMAYRMGPTGADKALATGADPMTWARDDMEGMERWECTINNWRGQ